MLLPMGVGFGVLGGRGSGCPLEPLLMDRRLTDVLLYANTSMHQRLKLVGGFLAIHAKLVTDVTAHTQYIPNSAKSYSVGVPQVCHRDCEVSIPINQQSHPCAERTFPTDAT